MGEGTRGSPVSVSAPQNFYSTALGKNLLSLDRNRNPRAVAKTAEEMRELADCYRAKSEEEARHQGIFKQAADSERNEVEAIRTLEKMLKEASDIADTEEYGGAEEVRITLRDCDIEAIAQRVRPKRDRVALLQVAVDLVKYRTLPDATERKLVAAKDLRYAEFEVLKVAADLSYFKMLDGMVAACFDGNEVTFVDKRTTDLRAAADEAYRRWNEADGDLKRFQADRATSISQRQASAGITRAEALHTAVSLRKESESKS